MSIKRAEKFLSYPSIIAMLLLFSLPVYVPIFAQYEGVLFPVTSYVQCGPETPDNLGDDIDCPGSNQYPILVRQEKVLDDKGVAVAVDVYLRFQKVRQCEFLREVSKDGLTVVSHSMNWYDPDDRRLRVDFEPEASGLSATRPTGKQITGPWRIFGIENVDKSYAIVEHDCHFLWNTFTKFFP